jgi:hypothetical protein
MFLLFRLMRKIPFVREKVENQINEFMKREVNYLSDFSD